MAVMYLEKYQDRYTIYNELKVLKNCPENLLLIVWFAFLPMVQNLMKNLDSKSGNKTIPRTALLIATFIQF